MCGAKIKQKESTAWGRAFIFVNFVNFFGHPCAFGAVPFGGFLAVQALPVVIRVFITDVAVKLRAVLLEDGLGNH